MGLVLYLLSYASLLFHICFVTISFAAGLYYISEIVEEYTEKAKKVIKVCTFCTIFIYVLLLIGESFSITIIACGLLAQVVHLAILRNFPNIKILSIEFWWVGDFLNLVDITSLSLQECCDFAAIQPLSSIQTLSRRILLSVRGKSSNFRDNFTETQPEIYL